MSDYRTPADAYFRFIGRLRWIQQKHGETDIARKLGGYPAAENWIRTDSKLRAAYPEDYATAATIQAMLGTVYVEYKPQDELNSEPRE